MWEVYSIPFLSPGKKRHRRGNSLHGTGQGEALGAQSQVKIDLKLALTAVTSQSHLPMHHTCKYIELCTMTFISRLSSIIEFNESSQVNMLESTHWLTLDLLGFCKLPPAETMSLDPKERHCL